MEGLQLPFTRIGAVPQLLFHDKFTASFPQISAKATHGSSKQSDIVTLPLWIKPNPQIGTFGNPQSRNFWELLA